MLVKEPARRLTLSDIENDPWLSQAQDDHTYVEPFITREEIGPQLHDNIIDTMVKGDVADRQKIVEYVNVLKILWKIAWLLDEKDGLIDSNENLELEMIDQEKRDFSYSLFFS